MADDEDPLNDQVRSAELEDEEGRAYRVDQQNQSPEVARGGGAFPDPETPPQPPAPGAE